MKKLISVLFFISKIQKKKISRALEEKLMQKLKKKGLKKKLKELKSRLSAQHTLSAKKVYEEVQRLARKLAEVKIKLSSAYIRRRKQKKKTWNLTTHALGLFLSL